MLKGGRLAMKDMNLLIWLTQLGLSVALPLVGFIFLAVWLHHSFAWGTWIIWVGILVGICSAISGFRNSLKAMELMGKDNKKQDPPPVSFNEHK